MTHEDPSKLHLARHRPAAWHKPVLSLSIIACCSGLALATPMQVLAQGSFLGAPAQQGFDDTLVDAADKGNLKAVTSLIQSGKYVDSQGRFGATPLIRAAYNGHADVVALLLSVGANPNIADIGGATPLHLAARQGFDDIINLILLYNADANVRDAEGWTPLMRAALHGHGTSVDMLIAKNADVNAQNKLGETALQHAAFAGNTAIVRTLVTQQADVTLADNHNVTAADLAYQRGHTDILSILAEKAPEVLAVAPSQPASDATLYEVVSQPDPDFIPVEPTAPAPIRVITPPPQAIPTYQPQMQEERRIIEDALSDEQPNAADEAPKEESSGWSLFSIFGSSDDKDEDKAPKAQPPATVNRSPVSPVVQVEPAIPQESTHSAATASDEFIERAPSYERRNPFAFDEGQPDEAPVSRDSGIMAEESSSPSSTALYADDPVKVGYLLQLGSFLNKSQAKQHWNDLRTKHADLLASYSPVISEAAIASGTRTVYRTQVGIIEDKAMAQQLCRSLFDRNVECFVVESSVNADENPAAESVPEWDSTDSISDSREPLPEIEGLPSAPYVVEPAFQAAPIRVPPSQQTAPQGFVPIPTYKPKSADELKAPLTRMERPASPVPEFEDFFPPDSKSELTESDSMEGKPTKKPAMPAPYPSDKVPRAKPSNLTPPAKQVTPSNQSRTYPVDAPLPWRDDTSIPETYSVVIPDDVWRETYAPPIPAVTPQPVMLATQSPTAVTPLTVPDVAETEQKLASLPEASTFSAAAPKAQTVDRDDASRPASYFRDYYDGSGVYMPQTDVEVAEAIRVPLSGMNDQRSPLTSRVVTPSRNTRQETIWVQLSAFSSETAARDFWNQLSYEAPEVTSGLRYRVVRPLAARVLSNRVSARVGPLTSQEQMQDICEAAAAVDLSCAQTVDKGESIVANRPRQRKTTREIAMTDRDAHIRKGDPALDSNLEPAQYWVQFGSYSHHNEAQIAWDTLQLQHDDLLSDQRRHIVKPKYSSSPGSVYRLRIGPFDDQLESIKLCTDLQKRQVACISVKN